MWVKI